MPRSMQRINHRRALVAAGVLGVLGVMGVMTPAVFAQHATLDAPTGRFFNVAFDTGSLNNPTNAPVLVFSDTFTLADSAWLRLYFDDAVLGPGSHVRVTSLQDGESQDLDALGVFDWNESTAYFNGDTVAIELIAGPMTIGNRLAMIQVAGQYEPAGVDGGCGVCNGDNRVPSAEDFAGRLLPAGCTASVWNTDSCLVSAGHCLGGNMVIEFRVPPSNPNCSIVHPPVADQFPITSQRSVNNGVGFDWMVMTSGTNSSGQRIFQRYGAMRPIAANIANVNDPITIHGFGVDTECVRSQTQQLSVGNITARTSTWYEYNADVTGGNSGSSILKNQEIIGIVTHCSFGCPNYGTRVDRADFVLAREQLCPGVPPFNLVVTGNCPGSMTATVESATPNATVAFLFAGGTGSFVVPNGRPCAGTTLGLNSTVRLVGTDVADANGNASIVGNAPAAACTGFLQALDLGDCDTTNVVGL